MPPPVTGDAMAKEVVTTPSTAASGVEEEVEQVAKDAQPILPFAPLVVQDPEVLQPPVPQDPKPMQTPSPTKAMTLEPTTEPALGKESLGVCLHLHK